MKDEAYIFWYVEPLNDARTELSAGSNILDRELADGASQPKPCRTRLRAWIHEIRVMDSALPS